MTLKWRLTVDELDISIKDFVTDKTKILFGPAVHSQTVPFDELLTTQTYSHALTYTQTVDPLLYPQWSTVPDQSPVQGQLQWWVDPHGIHLHTQLNC